MIYLIDAWLECAHPKLRLLNKVTGDVCLELTANQLTNLQEQGALDIKQLFTADPSAIQEISTELLEAIKYSLYHN